MLGLGWSEILVIAVVALIFVGPKDLPVVLRNLGQAFGAMRRMSNEFRREINKIAAIDEVKDISRSITSPITETRKDIAREFNQIRDGKVEPTGKIKPKDGQDDVYEAIAEKAGKAPKPAAITDATTETPAPAKTAPAKTAPAKTTRSRTAKPAATKEEGASEAPKPKRTRKAATTASKPATAKPAAAKPAAAKTRAPAKKAAKPKPAEPAAETPAEAIPAAPKRVRKPRKAAEPVAEQPVLETAETGDTQ